jgi:hypothetical protein
MMASENPKIEFFKLAGKRGAIPPQPQGTNRLGFYEGVEKINVATM